MNFIPDQPKKSVSVPFFDDVSGDAGWQGQTTQKSIETLKSEITSAISRLGGMVSGFQKGTFELDGHKREGFRIQYTIEGEDGKMIRGKMEIAALPVKEIKGKRGGYRSVDRRREQSLKMSLYMFRDAMNGLWFMQQLSPGYAPLMPFLLVDGDQTISQLYSKGAAMGRLLPPSADEKFISEKNGEVLDGEVKEVK